MWDICWLIDCLRTSLRIEARAHGRCIDEIQDNMFIESTGNDLQFALECNISLRLDRSQHRRRDYIVGSENSTS